MPDNVLYIIGNGFDLFHDIQSSYRNFAAWMRRHDPTLDTIYAAVCNNDMLWCDFETSMAYVDREFLVGYGEPFLPDENADFDDMSVADIILAGDAAQGLIGELVHKLKHDFHRWVSGIQMPKVVEHRLMIDDNARFLTFNYTLTMENLYGIDFNQVMHIHGKKHDPWGKIVVGHGEDTDKIFDEWWAKRYKRLRRNKRGKTYYPHDNIYHIYQGETAKLPENEMLMEAVEGYFDDTRKPVMKIIHDNADYFHSIHDVRYVYVWGHSFSNVDMPYFQRIIAENDDTQSMHWYVHCYNEKDKPFFRTQLHSLGLVEGQTFEFKNLNDFVLK